MIVDQKNDNDEILAIIVSNRYSGQGIKVVTPEEFSRQLAYTNRPNGHETQPHLRNPVPGE